MSRPHAFYGFLTAVVLISVAQAAKFPGGMFKANDGTNNIALDFDSTGAVTAYVNGESFSHGTWQAKADTLSFGTITGPEGYSCATVGSYLWAYADSRLSLTLLSDDCQVRRDALVGLTWTR